MTLYRDTTIRGYTLTQSGRPLKAYVYRGNGTDQLEHEYLRVPLDNGKETGGRPDCGTTLGYRVHRKAKEKVCDGCMEAMRVYNNEYAERRRARQ